MTQHPSLEELELEPLLDSASDSPEMASGNRDSVDDKVDVEKIEDRSVRSQSIDEPSPQEKKLVRKLDSRIMPLACILYLFACESLSLCRACSGWITQRCVVRFGQIQFRECPSARSSTGYPGGRSYWKAVRLGQLSVLLLICMWSLNNQAPRHLICAIDHLSNPGDRDLETLPTAHMARLCSDWLGTIVYPNVYWLQLRWRPCLSYLPWSFRGCVWPWKYVVIQYLTASVSSTLIAQSVPLYMCEFRAFRTQLSDHD